MLAVLAGEPVDRLPWAPRLDLWYKANKKAGTLPQEFAKATLMEITDTLDWGFHAVVPDFRDLRSKEDDVDRALGIYNLHTFPYRTVLENIQRHVTVEGDRTIVEYDTPKGKLRTVVLYDEAMRRAGITVTHIEEHAIKTVADYAPMAHIFAHALVEDNYQGYDEFHETVGDRGLAVGFISLAASPMHLLQRELMRMEDFFFQMHDHADEMAQLAQAIEQYWRRILDVASNSCAEVIFLGANYDASVTYPPFFAEHIMPWLREYAQVLHAQGKYLLTHTDGENTGLMEHYLAADIDIADSVCPAPMTKMTFREARDALQGKVTIMGGIPSVTLLEDSMSDAEFEEYLDGFFADMGQGDRLILGVSDTTPPAAKFERLMQVGRRAAAFRPGS